MKFQEKFKIPPTGVLELSTKEHTMQRSCIIGVGSFVPHTVVTNEELAKTVDTSDEWIVQRTGIKQRHVLAPHETVSDMAIAAIERCLKNANTTIDTVDAIICGTSTPDNRFPSLSAKIQGKLGLKKAFTMDVQAACAGFIYALVTADQFIKTGMVKRILVVGADALTRHLEWSDRGTSVLFGDGAGAILLEGQDEKGTLKDRGILSTSLESDATLYDALKVLEPSHPELPEKITMNGKEVFRTAVATLGDCAVDMLRNNGLTKDDLDWLVPHQANIRIIEAVAQRIDLPLEKVIITVDRHANTSAASVPLALDAGITQGKIKPGDLVLLEAFGAGMAWGSALIRL